MREKEVRADGTILELVVWQLGLPVPGSLHGFKYRLYYGRAGEPRCVTTTSVARAIIGISTARNSYTVSKVWKC